VSYKLRFVEACRCAETPGLGQQQPDTACSMFGTSVVSTAGWLELSRIFRINYAGDLSFVHLPTLIDPYCSAVDHPSPTSDPHQLFDDNEASPSNSSGVILAFLALTLRHCRDEAQDYLVLGTHDLTGDIDLSARFAGLANQWLVAHDSGKSGSRVEGLQVRLMLAMYYRSLGRCARSRLLLSQATFVASDLGILQDYHADSRMSEISIAMAFEAESMGVSTESLSKEKSSAQDIDEEVARRLSASCLLMDIQGSLGERHLKITHSADQLPAFSEDGTTFTVDANGQRRLSSACSLSQSSPSSSHLASSPTSYRPAPAPPDHLPADYDSSGRSAGNILSYYLHFTSLLHRIQKWTDTKPWK
jgi:hypothetical protein